MQRPDVSIEDTLADRVIKLVAERAALPSEEIALDAHFIEDLNFDSLDLVEFTMEIEEEFDLTVPDEVADRIATVRQAIDEVRQMVQA